MHGAFLAIVAGIVTASAQSPVEIDRTLQRVYGTVIMASDVRQARLLKLLTPAPPNDAAIQTEIENRLVILNEATRAASPEPPADQIAARRRAWAATWSSPAELASQMQRAGMSDRALDGWFRDTLKIEAYLEQRFPAEPKREERIAAWIKDLRARANLRLIQ